MHHPTDRIAHTTAFVNNPSSKLSQYLTEEIFPLTKTMGDNPYLLMPSLIVTAGENLGPFSDSVHI